MIKRAWWAVKVALFPHLERRTEKSPVLNEMRRTRIKAHAVESLLDTAIMDLTDALESKRK